MIKKFGLLLGVLLLTTTVNAQIYSAKQSYVRLFSQAPIVDIEAISKSAIASLNLTKKEVQIEIPVNSFTFKKALMQTTFNEKYMESRKYPNVSFKGKYNEAVDLTEDGVYHLKLTGKMSIHGVDRNKVIPVTLTVKNKKILFNTAFKILSADYKIKAADVIYRKVGQEVEIEATGVLGN